MSESSLMNRPRCCEVMSMLNSTVGFREGRTNEPDFRYALFSCVAVRSGLHIWGYSAVVVTSCCQMPCHMSEVHEREAHGQAQAQATDPGMGDL